jgi:formylglycine-generating enzyme required for sulfatase activity
MTYRLYVAVVLVSAACGPWAAADLALTNVVASQRTGGTGLVDVYYDLSGAGGPVVVDITFSNDDGVHWNVLPTPSLLSGDTGPGITNGANKHIVWDASRDRAGVNWPNARAHVIASELDTTITVMLPGGVPLEMVDIPAGSFQMGSIYDPPYSQDNEAPAHTVTINYGFQIGKFEVTQVQWYAAMNGFPQIQPSADPNLPVIYISWYDCQAFLAALNGLGLGTFRLPTEAEWEYVCRAGTNSRWSFGNDEANLGDYAWYLTNSGGVAHVVGQKLPNPFGLYDIHGNVWEWVQDWYHSGYAGAPVDGSAWEDPVGTSQMLRGGNFGSSAVLCRSAFRTYPSPDYRNDLSGLRLLRTP